MVEFVGHAEQWTGAYNELRATIIDTLHSIRYLLKAGGGWSGMMG